MTRREQLYSWLQGVSVHNAYTDECCPDYSCCQPNLLAVKSERIRFVRAYEDADEKVMQYMLQNFFLRSLADQDIPTPGADNNETIH